MAASLKKSENKVHGSIICTQSAFIWWKNCKNRSSISWDIWLNMPVFWNFVKSIQMSPILSGVTGPKFTKFLHDIEASFALLTHTLRSRYLIPFWIDKAISAGGVGNFAPFLPLNWLPWQRPLWNRKNWTLSRKFTQISSIWWKDRENQSSRYWDSFTHSKKIKKKKKKLTQAKYIALPASLPSGLKNLNYVRKF